MPNPTSRSYYDSHLTVKVSEPPTFASTGFKSFQTAESLPNRKPSTAGWLDTLSLSAIEHRPYLYNPRPGSNLEPIFTDWQPWPGLRLRTDM